MANLSRTDISLNPRKTKLLETNDWFTSLHRELQSIDDIQEKLAFLKHHINHAYALTLNENVLLIDDVLLQDQVDMLITLCYDTEDMMSDLELESRMSLKALAQSSDPGDDEMVSRRKRLLPLPTSLESTIISHLQKGQMISHAQTPASSMKHSTEKPLIGRDEDIMSVVQELTSLNNIESVGVSIVGMNGVGKSALANAILNHESVAKSFRQTLWASISGPFNPKEVGKKLLESYNESPYGAKSNYDVSILQLLQDGGPCLIVLDNLSDVTSAEWSEFQSSFLIPSSAKIIITTVDHNISEVTHTTRHHLHPLSDECCRSVILSNIKTGMKDPHQSLPAGIDILAQKCSGLPVAANFVASRLNDEKDWKTMLDGDLWEVPGFQREILLPLARTYSMLKPEHLRKCVAYFSLFPRGYLFDMEDLIQLWIAEGFIQCQEGSTLEQVGNHYFESLVRWFIAQPSIVNSDHNKPGYYMIHEFTHKLANLVASGTCYCLDEKGAYSHTYASKTHPLASKTRHLSLSCQYPEEYLLTHVEKLKGIRTLLPMGHINFPQSPTFFKSLLYIRVVSFKHTDVVEIPESIGELKFLRYLDVSHTRIRSLPETVSNLQNLCFLKLRNTENLRHLPMESKKLKNLRHIDWDINDIRRLSSLPPGIGDLTSLQRLPLFEVGEEEGYTIQELGNMVHLQGSICITNLENVRSKEEGQTAKLSSKKSLDRIEFTWTSNSNADNSEEVLIELMPPESLRILHIKNYGGRQFPQWLDNLQQLESLYLTGCRFLPALGHLPALKFLCIEDARHVELLGDLFHKSSYDKELFPAQETPKSKQLPELRQTDLPRLQKLEIKDCPKLISLPSLEHLTSLNDLRIVNCASLGLLRKLPSSLISFSIYNCDLLSQIIQVVDESIYSKGLQFQAGTMGRQDEKIRKHSRWNTLWPVCDVIIAMARMKGKFLTTALVNKIVPGSEAKACRQLLAKFPCHLEMMLHCLLFPKDYSFGKKRLIALWNASGFLKNEPKEDDINHFIDLLLNESFILSTTDNKLGETEVFKYNSLKFDSIIDEMRAIKHIHDNIRKANMVANRFAGYWDVSVTSGEIDEACVFLRKCMKLRSLLFLGGPAVTKVPSNLFSALKFVRTLDLSFTGIKELPSSIHCAKELRYLDLSWTLIKQLPDSIVGLCELQTLKLEGCKHLFSLPKRMNKLIKLRHFEFDILGQLTSMLEGIGSLAELRTLWAFIVGSVNGCKDLKNMNHLSGKFCLSGLENVMRVGDAREAALINKRHLSHLELRWSSIFKKIRGCNYGRVLEGLEPYKFLKDLHIICFPGSEFPKWVGDHSYSNLVSIMLYKCEDCKHLPTLGGLPNLQKLEIIEMNGVRVIDDTIPFLKLKTLTIDGMHCLEEWRGLNGDNFPGVDNLIIRNCPNWSVVSSSLPSLPSLVQLEVVNCSMLKSLPEGLLSPALQTVIIQDCPFGEEFPEVEEGRDNILQKAKVWILSGTQMIFKGIEDEDEDEEDDVLSSGNSSSNE